MNVAVETVTVGNITLVIFSKVSVDLHGSLCLHVHIFAGFRPWWRVGSRREHGHLTIPGCPTSDPWPHDQKHWP